MREQYCLWYLFGLGGRMDSNPRRIIADMDYEEDTIAFIDWSSADVFWDPPEHLLTLAPGETGALTDSSLDSS